MAPLPSTAPGGKLSRIGPGIRYMAVAAFFFSVMSLLVKAVGQRLPSQEIVFWRGLVTIIASSLAIYRAGVPMWGNRRKLLALRGALGFVALSCFFYSVVHLPLADATVIQYTNPVWTAVIAAIFLAERLGRRDAVALLVSLAGVVLIARPGFLFGASADRLDPVAVGVALGGAIVSASAYVTVRGLSKTEHPLVIVHYFAVAVVIGSLPVLFLSPLWPTPAEWLGLIGVGVSTHLAQVYMTRGLALEPAGRAMTVGYISIVFAVIWGALLFAEIPDALALGGAVLVVASTLWLGRRGAAGGAAA